MIINDMPGGGVNPAGSTTQPVYINSDGEAVATTYALNKTVPSDAKFTDTTYSSKSAASGGTDVSLVTTGEKYTWNNKGAGTITGIKMNGSSKGTSGVVDLGTVLTSHQSIKTINSTSLVGSGNISIPALPSVSTSDNGKILTVVNGVWTKATYYPPVVLTVSGDFKTAIGGDATPYVKVNGAFKTTNQSYTINSSDIVTTGISSTNTSTSEELVNVLLNNVVVAKGGYGPWGGGTTEFSKAYSSNLAITYKGWVDGRYRIEIIT